MSGTLREQVAQEMFEAWQDAYNEGVSEPSELIRDYLLPIIEKHDQRVLGVVADEIKALPNEAPGRSRIPESARWEVLAVVERLRDAG